MIAELVGDLLADAASHAVRDGRPVIGKLMGDLPGDAATHAVRHERVVPGS
jgi:hypothetical protein